jgi:HrpA-like RNA helicase
VSIYMMVDVAVQSPCLLFATFGWHAGRLAPGVAYRLWSETSHQSRDAFTRPQIVDSDLTPLALELSLWGVPVQPHALLLTNTFRVPSTTL